VIAVRPGVNTREGDFLSLILSACLRARRLELADGRRVPLAVDRWHGLADQDDRWMVEHCRWFAELVRWPS
jgi:hypothetical protein